MPILKTSINLSQNTQTKKSSWIGGVFGIWLFGIFAASLAGKFLSVNRSLVTSGAAQESKQYLILLLFAVFWPLFYFIFSSHRFIPLSLNRNTLVALFLFFLSSLISLFFSSVMLSSTAYWVLTIISVWVCLQFISTLDLQSLENGFKIYAVLLTFLLAYYSHWEYVPGVRLGEAHNIGMEPAAIGLVCISGIMSSMAIRLKLLRYSLVAILLYIVYLTGSRAPALAAFLGIYTIGYVRTRASGAALKAFVLVCMIAAAIGFIAFADDVLMFIDDFLGLHSKHRGLDSGGSGRIGIWKETWQLFVDNPAFGVGFRGHEARLTIGSSSHNGYLAMLAEVGLVGFLAIFYVVISGVLSHRAFLRNSKESVFIYSIFLGVCYSYLLLAVFERYFINSGNPTSMLFIVSILWPAVRFNSARV
jgi:O-antigen ligase